MKLLHPLFSRWLAATGVFVLLLNLTALGAVGRNDDHNLFLTDGWTIQSSADAVGDGAQISSPGFVTSGWHAAAVPTTVLSALVQDGTYTNIYFGTNLATLSTAPFTNAWWYRKEFTLSGPQATESADLIFEGINYRANVWVNGGRISTADQTFGAFRMFHFNLAGRLKPGANAVAVEVFPPQPGDFTMGFVDWNPKPADAGMGLFRPVRLHFYQTLGLENIFVTSKIDHATWQKAELTISADLINRATNEVSATVHGTIGDFAFNESFTVPAGGKRTVQLTPANHAELKLDDAKLWWPWELGAPNLYALKLTVADQAGNISDQTQTRFGIREVKDYFTPEGYRGYEVNGKKILIRGGGWADDWLLHEDEAKLKAQVDYAKAMNLNTIRMEGFWGSSQRLYDLADQDGMLIMVGWSCQWEWASFLGKKTDDRYGGLLTAADMELATNYLHDQVLWLRNHPAIYVWVLGSDKMPRPELETSYNSLLAVIDPTRPTLISCGDGKSKISGPSGVKMNGPYDYVTPNYWYLDTNNGGAFGYNTETGPGPQPPPLDTLQRMIPADHLWPMDAYWTFHCARDNFKDLTRYMEAFNARYGPAHSVAEFAFKSQAANYEAMRPMYESFAVNLPHTTGIIQWMLNASWPKLYWQLYDYYLVPGGAFYGAKKGAAPLAIIYNYADHGIYLVNQSGKNLGDYETSITVYDLNSQKILDQAVTNACPVYGSEKVFDLSTLTSPTPVYFVDLHTHGGGFGTGPGADNFYWLSTKPDVLDESKTKWFVTPNQSYADFTALTNLPQTTVQAAVSYHSKGNVTEATVTLTNPGDHLAFFLEMQIGGAQSQQMLTPVFWDDNYISLPPHSQRTFHARFPKGDSPELKLQGWNVKVEMTHL